MKEGSLDIQDAKKFTPSRILIIILSSLVLFVGVFYSVYMVYNLLNKETPVTQTKENSTKDTDEVTSIQSEEDLKTAKENLTNNGVDNTQSDEAKLKALTSQ